MDADSSFTMAVSTNVKKYLSWSIIYPGGSCPFPGDRVFLDHRFLSKFPVPDVGGSPLNPIRKLSIAVWSTIAPASASTMKHAESTACRALGYNSP